jgi:hypothetical protein
MEEEEEPVEVPNVEEEEEERQQPTIDVEEERERRQHEFLSLLATNSRTPVVTMRVEEEVAVSRGRPSLHYALLDHATVELRSALRLENFDRVRHLVHSGAVLWKANDSSGWTALHLAALSHSIPIDLWKWLLNKAAGQGSLQFWKRKNALGSSVLDIFFRSYLRPVSVCIVRVRDKRHNVRREGVNGFAQHFSHFLTIQLPWQRSQTRQRARLLLSCMEKILAKPSLLDAVRQGWKDEGGTWNVELTEEEMQDGSWEAVLAVINFITRLTALCRAMHPALSLTAAVASTGTSCPQTVARLLMAWDAGQMNVQYHPAAQEERLPLHWWCAAAAAGATTHHCTTTDSSSSGGMLEALLEANLDSVMERDPLTGALPVHLALLSGKSWSQVQPLALMAPGSLQDCSCQDLPAFAFAAMASVHDGERIEVAARRIVVGSKELVSLWKCASEEQREAARKRATDTMELEQLSTIYSALVECPQALQDAVQACSRRDGTRRLVKCQ